MKKILVRTALAVSVSALANATAFAAPQGASSADRDRVKPAERSQYEPHVGVFAGVAGQNGEAYSNSAAFMIDAGYQPVVPFSLAIQTQYQPGSIETPGPDVDFNTTNFLAKGTYNFGGTYPVLRHSYVGAKTGLTIYSGDVDTDLRLAAGLTAGFDIPITDTAISLGAEAAYLGVLGTDELTPDQTSVMGAMKYWF